MHVTLKTVLAEKPYMHRFKALQRGFCGHADVTDAVADNGGEVPALIALCKT